MERRFENAAEHDGGLESDAFDDMATHSLIFHRPTSDAIGTVRQILPRSGADLPIQQLLGQNGFRAGDYFPVKTAAEVPRFAISNQFRRRRCDGAFASD